MKTCIVFFAIFVSVAAARADFVMKQKMESSALQGELTIQVQGDQIRVDTAAGAMGDISTIMDLKTGDSVVLVHKQKMVMKMPGAKMKEMMERIRTQGGAGTNNPPPTPQPTGVVQTIGDYSAEIYTWSNTNNGTKARLWVAKDFPNYKRINEQLVKLKNSPISSATKGMEPDISALPGMVVRTETEMRGQHATNTLVSLKEMPIDASVFLVPKDYQEMAQPTAAAEPKATAASKIQASLAVGSKFPDFSEKDLAGRPLSIANYKGKVVLLDFWATWCGPCVAELPNVVKAYGEYHAKGFEIIGVSLDQDEAKLAAFLKQKNMTWQQFFDGKGWGNKLAVQYGVESIPATFLLDGAGNIIAKDLRGDALDAALARALAK